MRTSLLTFLFMVMLPSVAAAATIGALQVSIGSGLDPGIRRSVGNALHRATEASAHRYIPEAELRADMPSSSQDCFTEACLKAVAETTRVDGGLRVRFSGQAEIYSWTVDIYDLRTGTIAATEVGKCELCGVTEVEQELEKSLRAALVRAKFTPRPAAAAAQPATPTTPTTPTPAATAESTHTMQPAETVLFEVAVTPDDATITLDETVVGTGTASLQLTPGTYELAFAREGYGGLKESVTISSSSSDRAMLRVHLSKTDPDAVYIEPDGPMDRLGDAKKTYGLIGVGSGVVLLGLGVYLNAIDGRPTCDGPVTTCPRVRETSAAAFGTTFAGGVLLAGGLTFLLWDALSGRNEERQARVAPIVGESAVGVGVFARF